MTKNNCMLALTCFWVLLMCPAPTLASTEDELDGLCDNNPQLCEKTSRFLPHEPSYAIYNFTEDDERAMEAHYSFKYLLNSNNCIEDYKFSALTDEKKEKCIDNFETRWELYFKYTGRFDFYVDTRSSSPVINRISNPALHLRKYLAEDPSHHSKSRFTNLLTKLLVHDFWSVRYLDLGLFEHRSNGQVTEADEKITDPTSADFGRYKTQIAFEKNDHAYFDGLSRGANYLSLTFPVNLGSNNGSSDCSAAKGCFEALFSVKPIYYTSDSDITWGELAGSTTKFSDYDRYQVQLTDTIYFSDKPGDKEKDKRFRIEYSVKWTLGDELLDTDSLEASLHIPLYFGEWKLPLYIKAHTGPMKTLSNYTKEQDSIGIGLIFN